jgi:hypothetical protein
MCMRTVTCKRHPQAETRLWCSGCGDPICPRCAVQGAVGQKCPACARQARSARARGKPRQYVKGVAFGVAAAVPVAAALWAVLGIVGFFTWIASGVGGYGIARAVRAGAEGNAAAPFRAVAIGLAVVAVEAAWLLGFGVLFPAGLGLVTYLAAAYGAWIVYR